MADHPSPVAGELAEARDLCALPDPEQLDLIRDAVPGRDPRTAAAVAERRGRGRPPGALNRRNVKFREQLLAISGGMHPGLVLARAYSMPVEQLAAVLDCPKAEAFGFQLKAAVELLPYMESKQPTAVAIKSSHDLVLVMPSSGVSAEQLERVAGEIGEAAEAGIDWASSEIIDVLPSLTGTPLQDVSPSEAEQSGE
jgi:hypothetical protein